MTEVAYALQLEDWRNSSCRVNSTFNLYCSNLCVNGFRKISTGQWSGYNLIWLIPVNVVVSALGILTAPLMVVVNLVALAIFAVISCFSDDRMMQVLRNHFLLACTLEVFDIPLTLFMRVFFVQCSPITITTIVFIGSIANYCRCIDFREGIFLDQGGDGIEVLDDTLLPI